MNPVPVIPTSWPRLTNVGGYIVLILVNVAANLGYLGPTNADVSRNHPTPLTPAGWAFSIWGLIFVLQGAAVVHQARIKNEPGWSRALVATIGYGWQAGWYMECAWQLSFVHENRVGTWFSVALIFAALYYFARSLSRIYSLMHHSQMHQHAGIEPVLYIVYVIPTAINTAWLSVAASVAFLIGLQSEGVPQSSLVALALILALGVTLVGVWVMYRERDAFYGLTLVWALVAVSGGHRSPVIRYSSLACVVLLTLGVMISLMPKRQHPGSIEEGAGRRGLAVHEALLSGHSVSSV